MYRCVCKCICYGSCEEVRGQFTRISSDHISPRDGTWVTNFGGKHIFPTGPSHWLQWAYFADSDLGNLVRSQALHDREKLLTGLHCPPRTAVANCPRTIWHQKENQIERLLYVEGILWNAKTTAVITKIV